MKFNLLMGDGEGYRCFGIGKRLDNPAVDMECD